MPPVPAHLCHPSHPSPVRASPAAEIIILDGLVTIYRNTSDVWMYVVGSQLENELILVSVLTALYDALGSLLRSPPDKRLLLDNFDTLLLCLDEMIDQGMILETDAPSIVNRVGMKAADGGASVEASAGGVAGAAFSEGSFNSMFANVRESVARSLLK